MIQPVLPLAALLASALMHFFGGARSVRPLLLRMTHVLLGVAFMVSLLMPWLGGLGTTWQHGLHILGPVNVAIDLRYDTLSWLMSCVVCFISWVLHGYAARYLRSDPNQGRFMGQLGLLTCSVMLLMMAGGLLMALVAWQWIGLNLYCLLNHFHYDVNANKAAKKKYMINAVGDVCFLLAVCQALLHVHSTHFETLFAHAQTPDNLMLALLAVAVLTKSAQAPFHVWLIDTMEAPTPVSALMHAGVINAGGFLLARLSPLYVHAPVVLMGLWLIGCLTALWGMFYMLSHSDVKKQLAYSTMGQMGYMVLQCGLGCFSSAVFHLIAHGLFKATLFLSSGSTLNQRVVPEQPVRASLGVHALAAAWAGLSCWAGWSLWQLAPVRTMNPVLWGFVAVTLFTMTRAVWASRLTRPLQVLLTAWVGGLGVGYAYVLKGFHEALEPVVLDRSTFGLAHGGLLVFGCLAAMVWWGRRWLPSHWERALVRRVYWYGVHKQGLEKIYRRCLIDPLRRSGDVLLGWCQPWSCLQRTGMVLLWVALGIAWLVVNTWLPATAEVAQPWVVLTLLLGSLTCLLMANRVTSLRHLMGLLVGSQTMVTVLTCSVGQSDAEAMALFQWGHTLLVAAAWFLLLQRRPSRPLSQTLVHNRLPWCHVYLVLLLMFFLGVPGTPSFLTEVYVMHGLSSAHWGWALALGVNTLCMALVVLHTLQVHFFNPRSIAQHAMHITPRLHVAMASLIAWMVWNGVQPAPMLHSLSHLIGGVS